MNTFKRVDENRIELDGLVWDCRAEKSVKVKDNDNGFMVHSIKVEEVAYYPTGIDRSNKTKSYSAIVERQPQ